MRSHPCGVLFPLLIALVGLSMPASACRADDVDSVLAAEAAAHAQKIAALTKAAAAGDAAAMEALGQIALEDLSQDPSVALAWFKRAADKDSADALERIGSMQRDGFGLPQDHAEAMRWYEKAVKAGSKRAIASIGYMYFHGWGVPQSHAQALDYYRQAAEAKNPEGLNNLGHLYRYGIGVEKDLPRAIKLLEQAAAQNNIFALDSLGQMHGNGEIEGKRNIAAAVDYLKRAARLGHSGSMLQLGKMFENGIGVEQDRDEAFRWYHRAASRHPNGAWYVGKAYLNGWRGKPDPQEAVRWFEQAVKTGQPMAIADISEVHFTTGLDGKPDPARAIQILRDAAASGNAAAMTALALNYSSGRGVEKSDAAAMEWMKKAAALGEPLAVDLLKKSTAAKKTD